LRLYVAPMSRASEGDGEEAAGVAAEEPVEVPVASTQLERELRDLMATAVPEEGAEEGDDDEEEEEEEELLGSGAGRGAGDQTAKRKV
jgi:hypothetical protein